MMAAYGIGAKLIAGGTDLVVNMKKKLVAPEHVVSVARLDELKMFDQRDGLFIIGAGCTVAELAASDEINAVLSALGAGARALGSPLVRNRATIGGNLGSARPAADLPPPLMAYGSSVILVSTFGQRAVSLDQFFVGPGMTEIRPDEILSEIHISMPPAGAGAGYMNIGVRKAQDCNLTNVAAYLALDADGETIKTARVVMGCVGPTHLRSPSAEKILKGAKASPVLFEKAGQAAADDAQPIDDFRGCAQYKRDMAAVLTIKTLGMALSEARNRQA